MSRRDGFGEALGRMEIAWEANGLSGGTDATLAEAVKATEVVETLFAALCRDTPGTVTIRLSQETAQRLIHILEPVQDAALRDATYDMDTWLACQDVMTQIDGQTPLTFFAAPEQSR